jgi:hypothetical protein
VDSLANAAYPLDLASSGKAQLHEGVFSESAAPGSAAMLKVELGQERALGDLNGDGVDDAALTLLVDPGGSGTFTYLAVAIDDQGAARPLATILLGDRIIVKSIKIQAGGVVVHLLTRQPDEPMSAEPKLESTRSFNLKNGSLIEGK